MDQILLATRPYEYSAFVIISLNYRQGIIHFFASVDAFNGFALDLDVSKELTDTVILQKVYELTELPEFTEQIKGKSFTLIFNQFEHLKERIQNIIQFHHGTVEFNNTYHQFISAHFVDDIQKRLLAQEK